MPLFGWSRDDDTGKTVVRELGTTFEKKTPKRPVSVDLPAGEKETIMLCTLCGNSWRMAAQFARHFKGSHPEEYDDKDSWREYVEEKTIGASS